LLINKLTPYVLDQPLQNRVPDRHIAPAITIDLIRTNL
jgi:hypothetical protein